ncbi:MAG: hypothetical protein QM569_14590 [Acidovorax sp.]|uniref:hypothetical protein n=1 Tax=Acidovorax sp. TaxID=1872122 RepID=UPI0039E5BD4F
MTTLTIQLPDGLARQARQAGLLEPEQVAALIGQALRTREASSQLRQLTKKLDADPLPPMDDAEIRAEIDAYRREKHAAAGR